ncbi:MAG: hypothetical protein KY432_12055, partial [Acidobacteria bacterium]|nr:hypothetical protein [Acidobacteriota bacterium]
MIWLSAVIAAGLVMVTWRFVSVLRRELEVRRTARRVPGAVIEIRKDYSDLPPTYSPVFEYIGSAGERNVLVSTWGSSSLKLKVGDPVTILIPQEGRPRVSLFSDLHSESVIRFLPIPILVIALFITSALGGLIGNSYVGDGYFLPLRRLEWPALVELGYIIELPEFRLNGEQVREYDLTYLPRQNQGFIIMMSTVVPLPLPEEEVPASASRLPPSHRIRWKLVDLSSADGIASGSSLIHDLPLSSFVDPRQAPFVREV